jgi:catechol-2,3-dioxygenase
MEKKTDYVVPANTRIGHVHLKVSDLQRSLDFYCGLLGFEVTATYGKEAAFISAGGYHHHIGLTFGLAKMRHQHQETLRGSFILLFYTQQERILQPYFIDFWRRIIR